jgi:hypothetical protein
VSEVGEAEKSGDEEKRYVAAQETKSYPLFCELFLFGIDQPSRNPKTFQYKSSL